MTALRIGILTSGGDCPGLNAVIRAVAKTAANVYGASALGIVDGFHGLLDPPRTIPLGPAEVRGLLPRGGTILGTSNRGNPFAWKARPEDAPVDRSGEIVANAKRLGLDAVIVVGGEGSLGIARDLQLRGLPVVGVPKTIDNDISHTDLTFGFDSAVQVAADALDRLHTTAESHHRVMVLELMGRHAGWIALSSGIAGGADAILIPEIPYRIEAVARRIEARAAAGSRFSLVVVAEGAVPHGGDETFVDPETRRLGGVGDKVARELSRVTGRETRVTVLGHVQRGGSPTPYDRVLATRFGATAVRLAVERRFGYMVALRGSSVREVAIADAVGELKRVPPDGELVRTARAVGIAFGDETGQEEGA